MALDPPHALFEFALQDAVADDRGVILRHRRAKIGDAGTEVVEPSVDTPELSADAPELGVVRSNGLRNLGKEVVNRSDVDAVAAYRSRRISANLTLKNLLPPSAPAAR